MARNSLRKLVAVLLCVSFIISMSCPFTASAAETKGITNASNGLNVRTSAGVASNNILKYEGAGVRLPVGTEVTILKTVNSTFDATNKTWYKIKFTYKGVSLEGYVASQYITVYPPENDYTMPEDVPEKYKPYIEKILKYYPDWKFVFLDTGIEWNSLFGTDAQGYVGRSLIPYTSPLSYRSTASGCYDWRKDSWIPLDSNQWYQANTQTIAYYMDPRNFLNINDIFMFESLSYDPKTQTLDGVKKILSGSFMDESKGKIKDTNGKSITYAEAFIEAGKRTGVSPYHLASRAIQEVTENGKPSGSVTGKYKGYEGLYNFYNIGATQDKKPVANGLKYASGATSSKANKEKYMLPWDSQYKAIVGGAIWIGNGYINSVYKQNTLYFQKFNTSGKNYSHQYMGNIMAPQHESINIRKTYNSLGILNRSFTFIVPYYKNMPAKACSLPASNNYNPNNWLKALYVVNDTTGIDLIKGFDGATVNWNLGTVNAKTFTVSATPVNSKAKISGTGKVTLKEGENKINVVVTAENGVKRTYAITVTVPKAPDLPSGAKLGDVDGDGKITITDALLIFKHKSGEKTLSADAQKAADTNKNGDVDIADSLLIFKYKSGEITTF